MKLKGRSITSVVIVTLMLFISGALFLTLWGRNVENSQQNISVVNAAVKEVKLNYSQISLGLGEAFQLSAGQDGLQWRSSAPDKVIVDNKGKVKGLSEGTAVITVTNGSGKSSCKITVKKAPGSVTLPYSTMTLGIGEKYTFGARIPNGTASALRTFRTSNSKILKMTKTNWTGSFTAVGTGTAWITVKLYNGKEASCKIIVKNSPDKVSLDHSTLSLGMGESYTLSAVLPEGTASSVRSFRTSNSNIVKMTKTVGQAQFTAVGRGTAWVTVKLYNGKEASCKVNVLSAPNSVSLDSGTMYIKVGDSRTLKSIIPANTACANRNFRTSNSKIVKMTKTNWTGAFTAVSEGTAWVTVRLFNGVEKSCKIIVRNKPYIENRNGATYIDGILIVNKTYPLPKNYGNGLDKTTLAAFNTMKRDASASGIYLNIVSGFRSYSTQAGLYESYCNRSGKAAADRFSARPGHSEHQTGLAMDINSVYDSFAYTPEARWLKNNCYKYGFIIRYPEGKEHITGYKYESWHIRYVGKDMAKTLYESGLTLEEYFGISSVYSY